MKTLTFGLKKKLFLEAMFNVPPFLLHFVFLEMLTAVGNVEHKIINNWRGKGQ